LTSTSSKGEISFPCQRSSSPIITKEPHGRERLPQAPKDDAPNMPVMEGMIFVNSRQPREYITQVPVRIEHISQLTMGSTQDQFEIIAPFCMYTMGVFFPSPRIYKESF
jgi:hypothetical protein